MRMSRLELQNFRCFENERIEFSDYTALLGPNNSGKSTVLQAINIFYNSSPKNILIGLDDFRDTKKELRIAITWADLPDKAKGEFSHYVRQEELTLFIRASVENNTSVRSSIHGTRLAIQEFAPFFEAKTAAEKKAEYRKLRESNYSLLPDIKGNAAVDEFTQALHNFEGENPSLCRPLDSSDQAFGATGVASLLKKYADWVYIPAVKDASDEAEEAKNTAIGTLANRIIRSRVKVDEKIEAIKEVAKEQIADLAEAYKKETGALQNALNTEFQKLTSVGAEVKLDWTDVDDKSIAISAPLVKALLQDDFYSGDISRFGHGLQRNYLLALILLNARLDVEDQPSVILGCEEPELFQHPPQARHLYNALTQLAKNEQVLVTTHSSYFIAANHFHKVRSIKKGKSRSAKISSWSADEHRSLIANAKGETAIPSEAALASLEAFITPEISETFFCNKVVFVEGIEDRGLITEALKLLNLYRDFVQLGGHIVPVNGKGGLINTISIARGLEIPHFAIFDADSNCNDSEAKDNRSLNETLCKLLQIDKKNAWPDKDTYLDRAVIWKTDFQSSILECDGDWTAALENICAQVGWKVSRLKKNPSILGAALASLAKKNGLPLCVKELADHMMQFVRDS